METPSPIFSTGNKLSLHSWSSVSNNYESYDITYVTTDAGIFTKKKKEKIYIYIPKKKEMQI